MKNWVYAGGVVLFLLVVGFVAVPAAMDYQNDQAYLTVWGQANTELTGIYADCLKMGQAKAFASAGKTATNLSVRTKYWYDKLSPMPVSKNMADSKTARMQALTEEIAFADGWAAGLPKLIDGERDKNLPDLMSSMSDIRGASEHQTRMIQYTKMADDSLPK